MYSALQITSDSVCQNMTLQSEKLHIPKELNLPSELISQHKKLSTQTNMFWSSSPTSSHVLTQPSLARVYGPVSSSFILSSC